MPQAERILGISAFVSLARGCGTCRIQLSPMNQELLGESFSNVKMGKCSLIIKLNLNLRSVHELVRVKFRFIF